jgi:hypothetical protein
LRKGYLPQQKFRSVLHSQNITLTTEEYAELEAYFSIPESPLLTNYKLFCDEIDTIFTSHDLEREPLKKTETFVAPSILDAKNTLAQD